MIPVTYLSGTDLSKILIAKKSHLPTTLVNVHMGYLIWTEGHDQLLLPGKHLVEDNFVGAALMTVVQPEKMLLIEEVIRFVGSILLIGF